MRQGLSYRKAAISCTAILLGQLAVPCAHAQLVDQFVLTSIPGIDTETGVTVTTRLHPEYDSVPITIGNTTISPMLNQSFGYDSNVMGISNGKGSALSDTSANVSVIDKSADTTIGATIYGDRTQYFSAPNQSQTNWNAAVGFEHMLGEDNIGATYSHTDQAETARTLDVPLLDSPISERIDDIKLYYNADLRRVSVQPGLEVNYTSFDNGTVAGQPFNQSQLDFYGISPSLTMRYNLAPLRDLLLILRDSVLQYPERVSQGRNANSISALTGIDDVDGLWRIRALAGVESRSFQGSQFDTITTPTASLSVIWTPTALTTLTSAISRHLAVSSQLSQASYVDNELRLSVDHEVLRNVILGAYLGGVIAQYPSGGGTQTLYEAGASGEWLINRMLRLQATYDFTTRSYSGASNTNAVTPANALINGTVLGGDYSENVYMLQAKLAF